MWSSAARGEGKIIKREENKEIDKLSQTGPRYRNVSRQALLMPQRFTIMLE